MTTVGEDELATDPALDSEAEVARTLAGAARVRRLGRGVRRLATVAATLLGLTGSIAATVVLWSESGGWVTIATLLVTAMLIGLATWRLLAAR